MEYPKPVMRMTELQKMGFPQNFLYEIYRKNVRNIAWKQNPTRSNSPIMFDTGELEKYRVMQSKAGKVKF